MERPSKYPEWAAPVHFPLQRIYSMLLLKGQRQGQHIQQTTHLWTQADGCGTLFTLFFESRGEHSTVTLPSKLFLKALLLPHFVCARGTLTPCCLLSCSAAVEPHSGFAALSLLSEGSFQINKWPWSKQAYITEIMWIHRPCAAEGNTTRSFSHWSRTQELAFSSKQLVQSMPPGQNTSVAGAVGGARHLCSLFIKKIKKQTLL